MVVLAYNRDGLCWDGKESREDVRKKINSGISKRERRKAKMKENTIHEKNRNRELTQIRYAKQPGLESTLKPRGRPKKCLTPLILLIKNDYEV